VRFVYQFFFQRYWIFRLSWKLFKIWTRAVPVFSDSNVLRGSLSYDIHGRLWFSRNIIYSRFFGRRLKRNRGGAWRTITKKRNAVFVLTPDASRNRRKPRRFHSFRVLPNHYNVRMFRMSRASGLLILCMYI